MNGVFIYCSQSVIYAHWQTCTHAFTNVHLCPMGQTLSFLKGRLFLYLLSGPQLHSLPQISAPLAAAEPCSVLQSANLSVCLPDNAWPTANSSLRAQEQTPWGAANITTVQIQLTECCCFQIKYTVTHVCSERKMQSMYQNMAECHHKCCQAGLH